MSSLRRALCGTAKGGCDAELLLARGGELRNGAPPMAGIALRPDDVAPLASFLRALNEDYE